MRIRDRVYRIRTVGRRSIPVRVAPALSEDIPSPRSSPGPNGPEGRMTNASVEQERENVPEIPASFVIITQVLLIPVVGVTAALIASRIPSLRSDI